jgi:hypothetical protein
VTFKRTILQALLSKIVTAAITTPIFSFLLGLLMSNPFGERATHWQGYLTDTIQITPTYMLYSFPVILVELIIGGWQEGDIEPIWLGNVLTAIK